MCNATEGTVLVGLDDMLAPWHSSFVPPVCILSVSCRLVKVLIYWLRDPLSNRWLAWRDEPEDQTRGRRQSRYPVPAQPSVSQHNHGRLVAIEPTAQCCRISRLPSRESALQLTHLPEGCRRVSKLILQTKLGEMTNGGGRTSSVIPIKACRLGVAAAIGSSLRVGLGKGQLAGGERLNGCDSMGTRRDARRIRHPGRST